MSENKIGRNDPCPCGSSIKYKKCCLPKEEQANLFLQQQEDQQWQFWFNADNTLGQQLLNELDSKSIPTLPT